MVAFAEQVFPFAVKRHISELGSIDDEVVSVWGKNTAGLEIMNVQLVGVGPADRSDLRGCSFEIVWVGKQGAYLKKEVPVPAMPRVATSAPYEGKPKRRETSLAEAPRVINSASFQVLFPGSVVRTVVSLLCYCSKLRAMVLFKSDLRLHAIWSTRWWLIRDVFIIMPQLQRWPWYLWDLVVFLDLRQVFRLHCFDLRWPWRSQNCREDGWAL